MNSKNRKTKNAEVRPRDRSKANSTKERLLSNARQVFIETSYKTGSIRNISSSHNLVWYHFGSKANLFNALTSRLSEEVSDIIPSFVQEIERMPPKKGLEHFVKQFLDFLFTHPDSMNIINRNLGNCDESEIGFPGLDIMQAIHNRLFTSFKRILPKYSSEKDLERWCLVFLIYIINFIGAMRASQVTLNLKPYRHMYQEWLEDFIVLLLFPSYNHLIVGPQALEFKDIDIQNPKNSIKPEVIADDKEKVLPEEDPPPKKGDVTRQEILKAARTVFTKHPYEAASIRMIGKQSHRDFTLIHHYFPTKEILFKEVARELFDEVLKQIPLWHQDTPFNSLHKSFSMSDGRAVESFFHNRDVISLIMQNIVNIELMAKVIPAVQYFNQYIDILLTYSRVPNYKNQSRMWYIGLILNYLYLVGASHYFARMLEMNPDSIAYKMWIKDTNIFILYPVLRRLMLSSASE